MAFDNLMVFSGNANPRLAQQVARQLNIQLGKANVAKFSDGEIMVELLENVRGKDVFVLQSTCAPTNDHLMELMIMVDSLPLERRAHHRRIAVLRLCAPGPPAAQRAGRDLGEGRGEHADGGRREPAADDGPA